MAGFDRIAGSYAFLERLFFGRALERARLANLPRVVDCGRILIVGEGDGRFLDALLKECKPDVVDCVEPSYRMLVLAHRRIGDSYLSRELRFIRRPMNSLDYLEGNYDLIVTNFFLDMFTDRELDGQVARLDSLAGERCMWIVSDFRYAADFPYNCLSRLLLWTMYRFFRCVCGLRESRLELPAPVLRRMGWVESSTSEFYGGFVYSSVFERMERVSRPELPQVRCS